MKHIDSMTCSRQHAEQRPVKADAKTDLQNAIYRAWVDFTNEKIQEM